jgi:hypothetical protein
VIAANAVRIALERNRTILQVRQEPPRNPDVVVEYLRLGEASSRVENLVKIETATARPSR